MGHKIYEVRPITGYVAQTWVRRLPGLLAVGVSLVSLASFILLVTILAPKYRKTLNPSKIAYPKSLDSKIPELKNSTIECRTVAGDDKCPR